MRFISGFVAAAILAALAQPVFASCVYHGAVKVCHDDPKYWTPSTAADAKGPEKPAPTEAVPASSLKAAVMQPSAATDNAWVMMPEGGDGASLPSAVQVGAPACEAGSRC